jgi:LuxR family maltose regulon positive regulatory protein
VKDCKRALAGHSVSSTVESLDDGSRWSLSATPVTADSGEVVAAVVVLRDASSDVVESGGGASASNGRWTVKHAAPAAEVVARSGTVLLPPAGTVVLPDVPPVARRAMLHRLADSATTFVALRAPAGYGKTTLLRQWAAADRRPFAWVDVAAADNDTDVLISSIAAAVSTAPSPDNGSAPGRIGFDVAEVLAAAAETPFVLVLDGADALTSPGALELVERLVQQLPAQSQIAIASRRELDLPAGRFVAEQRMTSYAPRDLAMSAAEARAFFEGCGIELEGADIEALVRQAEGWPMALRLQALALLRDGGVEPLLEAGGREELIAAYLRDEFMRGLEEDDLQMLQAAAPLGELSGDLCDAVLETTGSAGALLRLAREGALLFPLDHTGERYHVHGLLQDMLAAELGRGDPEAAAAVYSRAGEWWRDEGDWRRAVRFARAGGDSDRAGAMILARVPDTIFTRDEELDGLVADFTVHRVRANPTLALAKAWTTLMDPRQETAMWCHVAEHRLETTSAAPGGDVPMALHLLRAMLAEAGCAQMREDAAQGQALAPPAGAWSGVAAYLEGVAAYLAGDADHSTARLEEARRLGPLLAPAARALIAAQLALNASERSDGEAARELSQEADAALAEAGLEDDPGLAIVDAVSALTRLHAGNESAARMRHRAAVDKVTSEPSALPWMSAIVRVTLARTALQLGDGPGARTFLLEARMAWRPGLADADALQTHLETLRTTLDAFPAVTVDNKAGHLTPAELRVLRLLPTHLSFRQIGEQLFLSRHTVKTEAISTYRKLGVTSRSEAVARAGELGLL